MSNCVHPVCGVCISEHEAEVAALRAKSDRNDDHIEELAKLLHATQIENEAMRKALVPIAGGDHLDGRPPSDYARKVLAALERKP